MADYTNLFKDDDFRAYRKELIQAAAEQLHNMLSRHFSTEEVNGALDMARKIITLPNRLTGDQAVQQMLEDDTRNDFMDLTSRILRERYRERTKG